MSVRLTSVIAALLLSASPPCYSAQDGFASSSLLAEGLWYRVKVTEEGVYRISYSDLADMGFGDPSSVRMYGNNFGQLSYYNDDPRPDDLRQIALWHGTGGTPGENHIYFYARSTHRWRYCESDSSYHYLRHNYSDTAFYFITSAGITALEPLPHPPPEGTTTGSSSSYDILMIHEKEHENIIRSGREWYQPVSPLRDIDIATPDVTLVPGEPFRYSIRVAARSSSPSLFRVDAAGENLISMMVQEVNMYNTTGTFARYAVSEGYLPSEAVEAGLKVGFHNNGVSLARGWLDYIRLHGRAELIAGDDQLIFSDSRSAGEGNITEFTIEGSVTGKVLWDVTDPYSIEVPQTGVSGSQLSFRSSTDTLRRFIFFDPSTAPYPIAGSEPLPNQNLHATGPVDMLIVTHPWFTEHARRLAELHYEDSGLLSEVVSVFEIYNEFSGGTPDVCAIRNFVRMVWLRHSESDNPLRYLLLFGDGSYENRLLPPDNPNFVPTWQSQNSNIVISSFVSDDFYGLLDAGEGESGGFLNIGIGRLPVSDTAQATDMVNKIEHYMRHQSPGPWRNMYTFAADDGDGNIHMTDSENLVTALSEVNPSANTDKVYFDAYRQVITTTGRSYPDATRAINERIDKGTVILNYIGHGSEHGLAHERVVKVSDINGWRNIDRLFLLITATCEFSRFDNVDYNMVQGTFMPRTSAGEMALLNPSGGAIALMSTSRVVFSAPNFILNRNIIRHMFDRDENGDPLRLGDIIRIAKVNSGSGNNKRSFVLLGDPALRLHHPHDATVHTDRISTPDNEDTDTLRALTEATITGHISDREGVVDSSFNGIIHITLYDKPASVTTLANSGGSTMEFPIQKSKLFNGKSRVIDGQFSATFMVPRDIDYDYGPGKISYYAWDSLSNRHATGYHTPVTGGFSENLTVDTTGPDIDLYLNNKLFRPGGITDSSPVLLAVLSDSSGINATGAGVGRDITLWIGGDRNNPIILNSYYQTALDDYRRGYIRYPLGELPPGEHTVTLKAWDNYNNSTEQSLSFIVRDDQRFIIDNIVNFPNPFGTETRFVAAHNRPGHLIEVEIAIFDLSGRKIRVLRSETPAGGYMTEPVVWDGRCERGSRAEPGIYIYRITLRSSSNEVVSGSGRLIIL